VLVVDDSSFLRARIRQILDPEGYNLVEAKSGLAALEEIEKCEFACIVTDLAMPELDGFGLLEELRRRRLATPVVVLTADIQNTTRHHCEQLGAAAVLQKPIKAATLRSVVSCLVGGGY
jgi:CheY-like chemotaxis protein